MNIRTRISFTPVPGAEKYGVKYRSGPIGQNGQPQLGDEVVLEFPADDLTHQAPYPMGCMGNFVFIDINAPEGNFVALGLAAFAGTVWGKTKAYNFIANPAGVVLSAPERLWMDAVAIEAVAPALKIAGSDAPPDASVLPPPVAECEVHRVRLNSHPNAPAGTLAVIHGVETIDGVDMLTITFQIGDGIDGVQSTFLSEGDDERYGLQFINDNDQEVPLTSVLKVISNLKAAAVPVG